MTTVNQSPSPGWYYDPAHPVLLRWWDGTSWSPHLAVAPRRPPPLTPPPAPRADAVTYEQYLRYVRSSTRSGSRAWISSWGLGITALVLIVLSRTIYVTLAGSALVLLAVMNRHRR